MPRFTTDDLQNLARYDGSTNGTCAASIYLPMEVAGPEQQQNSVRFKNALAEVERLAEEQGCHEQLRETLKQLAPIIDDEDFWRHQQNGLVLFANTNGFYFRRLAHRLPEVVRVGPRYFLLPLVPVVQRGGEFAILAVSRKHTRLLTATRDSVAEVATADLPESVFRYLPEREKQFGLHAFRVRRGDGQTAVPHGHPDENDEGELRQFFNEIVEGVREALPSAETPVVFAGVEDLLPYLKEAGEDLNLVDGAVFGNPDETANEELHRQAMPLAQHELHKPTGERLDILQQNLHGDMATSDAETVVAAAGQGQVDTLFLNETVLLDQGLGATPTEETVAARTHAEQAVRGVLMADGDLFAANDEQLSGQPMAAILRYPVTATATSA